MLKDTLTNCFQVKRKKPLKKSTTQNRVNAPNSNTNGSTPANTKLGQPTRQIHNKLENTYKSGPKDLHIKKTTAACTPKEVPKNNGNSSKNILLPFQRMPDSQQNGRPTTTGVSEKIDKTGPRNSPGKQHNVSSINKEVAYYNKYNSKQIEQVPASHRNGQPNLERNKHPVSRNANQSEQVKILRRQTIVANTPKEVHNINNKRSNNYMFRLEKVLRTKEINSPNKRQTTSISTDRSLFVKNNSNRMNVNVNSHLHMRSSEIITPKLVQKKDAPTQCKQYDKMYGPNKGLMQTKSPRVYYNDTDDVAKRLKTFNKPQDNFERQLPVKVNDVKIAPKSYESDISKKRNDILRDALQKLDKIPNTNPRPGSRIVPTEKYFSDKIQRHYNVRDDSRPQSQSPSDDSRSQSSSDDSRSQSSSDDSRSQSSSEYSRSQSSSDDSLSQSDDSRSQSRSDDSRSQSSSESPEPPIIPVPLLNPQGYCFFNSIIQMLRCCRQFTDAILEYHHSSSIVRSKSSDHERVFVNYFCQLMCGMEDMTNGVTDINQMIKVNISLGKMHEYFLDSADGNDVQKCFMVVLTMINNVVRVNNAINTEISNSKKHDPALESFLNYKNQNDGFVFDLFYGVMCFSITCRQCKYIKRKSFQMFKTFPLPIREGVPEIKLTDCIRKFLEPSYVNMEEKMECNCPEGSMEFSSQCVITKAPKYLFIYLSRGSYYENAMKNNTFVKFREKLLLPTLSSVTNYKLISVIDHVGNNDDGHYYCKCNYERSDWWLISDSQVQRLGRSMQNIISKQAIGLIYKQYANLSNRK